MLKDQYVFVLYDISSNALGKVFKICKKYFKHHQKSIFRGHITPADLIEFKNEIKKVISKDIDFITIISCYGHTSFNEETIGNNKKQSEHIFI